MAEGRLGVGGDGGSLELWGSLDDEEFGDNVHWTFWCPVEQPSFEWLDPSEKVLGGGYLGFRQMAPLRAACRKLVVEKL